MNEGSAYSLTLGAVTDPGTDTVTSYVVHWGDGSNDTYATDGAEDAHLRGRPERLDDDHGRPGRRGRHVPRPANALSVHVDNVAPSIAISGAANVNEGSVVQPDPGCGHRSGSPTRSRATSSTGATATATPTRRHGAKTHTYADGPNDSRRHRRPDRRGRHVPRPRERAVGDVDNVAPSIAISGEANVNEGSAYTLTLGAVTDPGTDTVTS